MSLFVCCLHDFECLFLSIADIYTLLYYIRKQNPMSTSNYNPVSNAQPHSYELHSLQQVSSIPQQQLPLPTPRLRKKTKRKCHGNRKLQRFKKKYLKRGLTKEEVQALIDQHNLPNKDESKSFLYKNK